MESIDLLLKRRVAEVIDAKHLRERLASGKKLRVKLGVDSNKPDLHIGHAVPLKKLREFQDAGHTAVLIFGDYTAQLGDPSDRSDARKLVSAEETKSNADAYLKQVFKILDPAKTEIRRNSEWFNAFDLRKTIELMSTVTVNQLLAHETFSARLAGNQPLHFHEPLYSIMQGYDSVMVNADVELGGLDQKFNVLMGRTIQRAHGMPEQDVILMSYVPGTDGQAKMSKSVGNVINLNDEPDDMFGKVMSIPDAVVPIYFELATDVSEAELARLKTEFKTNPRDVKVTLAKEIVSTYHSHDAAEAAEDKFDRTFRQKETPEDVQTLVLPAGDYELADVLVTRSNLVNSRSEVRRLVGQGGVKINRTPAGAFDQVISLNERQEVIIQIGSRRWLKIVWK